MPNLAYDQVAGSCDGLHGKLSIQASAEPGSFIEAEPIRQVWVREVLHNRVTVQVVDRDRQPRSGTISQRLESNGGAARALCRCMARYLGVCLKVHY